MLTQKCSCAVGTRDGAVGTLKTRGCCSKKVLLYVHKSLQWTLITNYQFPLLFTQLPYMYKCHWSLKSSFQIFYLPSEEIFQKLVAEGFEIIRDLTKFDRMNVKLWSKVKCFQFTPIFSLGWNICPRIIPVIWNWSGARRIKRRRDRELLKNNLPSF